MTPAGRLLLVGVLRQVVGQHQVEKCLASGPFNRQRGTGNEILYTLAEQRTPESRPLQNGKSEIQPLVLRK
jgi:hypothetical protein